MLYYNFYGYEEFKTCFGLEKRDNDTVARKNKILLSHLKNPALKPDFSGNKKIHKSLICSFLSVC